MLLRCIFERCSFERCNFKSIKWSDFEPKRDKRYVGRLLSRSIAVDKKNRARSFTCCDKNLEALISLTAGSIHSSHNIFKLFKRQKCTVPSLITQDNPLPSLTFAYKIFVAALDPKTEMFKSTQGKNELLCLILKVPCPGFKFPCQAVLH